MTKEEFNELMNTDSFTAKKLKEVWYDLEYDEKIREYYLSTQVMEAIDGTVFSISRIKRIFKIDESYYSMEASLNEATDEFFSFAKPKLTTKERVMRGIRNIQYVKEEENNGTEKVENSED